MRRWRLLFLATTPVLLLVLPATSARADTRFANIAFADQAHVVTLTLPSSACRTDRAHFDSCQWELFVNEPAVAGQPEVASVTGTSGVLSVAYPTSFCGVLQADALFGSPLRKMVGYRHQISTCGCSSPSAPGWPTVVTGTSPVRAHFPQGIYVSQSNNEWTLYATHPHSSGQVFTGTISTNGTFTHLQLLKLEGHDTASQIAPDEIKFRFVNRGYLDGISFVPTCASQLSFDTSTNGSPTPPSHFLLGPTLTPAGSSPVTFSS